jgi:DNA-binding IclR family transcriptional regulator
LQLLSQFSREQPELSGAELARQLELPRASVFRMLCTLEQAGFLERCVDGVHYKLGLGVLRLGFELLASMELTELGRPVIEELRERSGYSAHLVVRDGREVVFIAKVAGRSSLFQSVQVGARLPAHATVLGRVLLSDLSAGELAALYRHASLAAYTGKTPTTLSELSELIAQDRQRGHGISMGGYESGISTVAAPVFSGPGKVAAAISVTVPAQSIEAPELAELVAMVCDAARQLSDRLQHLPGRGPWSTKTSQRKAA